MIKPIDNAAWRGQTPGLAAPTVNMPSLAPESFSETLAAAKEGEPQEKEPLREAFQDFVGQTLFGQMLSSMRSTVGKPAYFHGGRGEEVFQQQLDQLLVEEISEASASTVADPMFELFQLQRSQ
jgi:peptidoglycan hydrolase FlgJ